MLTGKEVALVGDKLEKILESLFFFVSVYVLYFLYENTRLLVSTYKINTYVSLIQK